jgi:hypothetical protein
MKWKEFGLAMADSYEELKRQFNELSSERAEDKQIIESLQA